MIRARFPRHLLLVGMAAASLSVAGCGGGGQGVPTTAATSAKSADPGRETMRTLVAAARARDQAAVEVLLSTRARRLPGEALRVLREARPFTSGYRVVVSEKITDHFGLVAVEHWPEALALSLRLEGDRWKVDTGQPLEIQVLGPLPGQRTVVGQVAVELHGREEGGAALLYLDGVTLIDKVAWGPESATVFANLDSKLERGRHVAVAFATRGDHAAARAWTFVAL